MATASKTVEVTLTLNDDEAQALVEVLSRVGGDPDKTLRGFTESIFTALTNLGYTFTRLGEGASIMKGSLTFI